MHACMCTHQLRDVFLAVPQRAPGAVLWCALTVRQALTRIGGAHFSPTGIHVEFKLSS